MRQHGFAGAVRPRMVRRLGLTAGSGLVFLGLLAGQVQGVDPGQVLWALAEVAPSLWLLAALATWVSFRAVAGYDLALHRHLGTGIDPLRARQAGFSAIAIGQTVGMGLLSGTLVRWHLLPELGLAGAARLSLLVALSFLGAWAVVTAMVLAAVPVAGVPTVSGLALVAVALLPLLVLLRPAPICPNLITLARLIALAAIDCTSAALAFWLLLPADIAFLPFLPVFLLAFGAGLVSGSPAGLGAFEIVLLALLPTGDEALLAAVLGWRVLYYAIPALIGAAVALLARGGGEGPLPALTRPEIAEAGLAAQGDLVANPAGFIGGRTAHGLVALSAVADPARFGRAARDEARWPVIYKARPRVAARSRRAGLAVLPIAREAWLAPGAFRLDVPARSGLRRKLRRAAAMGVTAGVAPDPDWAELARINAAWVAARGGEHGFSMGRFDPAYCATQILVVARQGEEAVGFATFHAAWIRGERVWTLDLLRPAPAAPEGTAQTLVMAALDLARGQGVRRMSLAAVPIGSVRGEGGLVARLGRVLAPTALQGLAQFKSGFAPHWQRLYIIGPSHLAVALVGWEIWRKVRHRRPAGMSRAATQDADNEFASARNPWQRGDDRTA